MIDYETQGTQQETRIAAVRMELLNVHQQLIHCFTVRLILEFSFLGGGARPMT